MASEFGRGAQVRLGGDGRQYARGGTALRLIDNIREKLEEESAGSIADGNTPDGSTRTGTAAEDEVFAPGGGLVTSIADEATARIAGDAVNAAAISAHSASTNNPHGVTAAQIGAYSTATADTLLATKAPLVHTHATADVTGLDTALAGKAATSHTHTTSDVTGLVTALAGKAAVSHAHATSDITGLDAALAGKAAVSHAHIVTDVTGLQSALDAKAATVHTHTTGDISGLGALATKNSVAYADIASGALASTAQLTTNTASLLVKTDALWAAASPLASSGTGSWSPDMNAAINFDRTLTGNSTLGLPTNIKVGQSGYILVRQDATGSRTLAFDSFWDFGAGAPTVSTAASSIDVIPYFVVTSTKALCGFRKGS